MLNRNFGGAMPRTRAVMHRATNTHGTPKSAPPSFRPGLRPYLLPYLFSVGLFAAASGLMYAGDSTLLRHGLPWALVSLLVVAAAGSLWGVRPAVLVLALSALFGDLIVPDLHISYFYGHDPSWHVRATRLILFVACGAATIWLTYRAQLMQERAERERGVVAALQSMILPERLANAPGYDLFGVYKPARHEEAVGGDLYDFYPLGAGHYGLLIGDVMGKGKEAAASTALLRYSVRALTSTGMRPAEVLSRLDDLIESQGLDFGTASLFVGVLDACSGELRYASAGHEPPLLAHADGREEALDSTGPILGVGLGLPYVEGAVVLGSGDALLLMTDGVTEARGPQGQFLESGGVWRLLRLALAEPTAARALFFLTADLTAFIGGNARDDIAMVLLRRTSASCVAGMVAAGAGARSPDVRCAPDDPLEQSDSRVASRLRRENT